MLLPLTELLPVGLLAAAPDPRTAWAPVVLLILIGIGFVVGNIVLSTTIGPRRTGPGKESTYESGMVPIGDTRKRFNVRFYIVAMVFLVFDVEIVFLYPWATVFPTYAQYAPEDSVTLIIRIAIFVGLLLLSYVYAWGKQIFDFE